MPLTRIAPLRRSVPTLVLLASLVLAAAPAAADEYDSRRAGHPLRVVAYMLHPIGVAFDWLLFRPAHWIGSQPVVRTIFGHEVDEDPQR